MNSVMTELKKRQQNLASTSESKIYLIRFGHRSHFLPPENYKKPKVFRYIQ